MPPKKTSGTRREKTVSAGNGESSFTRKKPEAAEKSTGFQSELAVEIIEELYPLLLANCTDEDDEIDTQAVFDVLAGLMGIFAADYQESYGHDKAMAAFEGLVALALETYQQRVAESEA